MRSLLRVPEVPKGLMRDDAVAGQFDVTGAEAI